MTNFSKDFWNMTQKARRKKINWTSSKLKTFAFHTVKKMKRQVTGRRKCFQNLYPTKDWYLGYNKNVKWTKILNTSRNLQIANKHIKSGLTTTRKCKLKPHWDTTTYPPKWLKFKTDQCKTVQPLWKTVWKFL